MVFVPAFGKMEVFVMKNSVSVAKQEADKNSCEKIEINKVSRDGMYGVEVLWDCDINKPWQGGSEMSWFYTKEEQEVEYNKALKENGMSECTLEDIKYVQDITFYHSIDEEGNPTDDCCDDTDGDFRCFMCENCQEEFDTFDEVKEHIND